VFSKNVLFIYLDASVGFNLAKISIINEKLGLITKKVANTTI